MSPCRQTRDAFPFPEPCAPDKINELWNDIQELWFPEGRNDPTLILLEIVPAFAEYWDRSGVEAVKFMFAAAKSMATGEPLGDGEGKHGKIRFSASGSLRE